MATLTVKLELLDIQRVDGLCPECWLPSLLRVTFAMGNDRTRGVPSSINSVVVCSDCRHRP